MTFFNLSSRSQFCEKPFFISHTAQYNPTPQATKMSLHPINPPALHTTLDEHSLANDQPPLHGVEDHHLDEEVGGPTGPQNQVDILFVCLFVCF